VVPDELTSRAAKAGEMPVTLYQKYVAEYLQGEDDPPGTAYLNSLEWQEDMKRAESPAWSHYVDASIERQSRT
jgi:hypothetical protein